MTRLLGILYRSEALTSEGEAAERTLMAKSLRNNLAHGITGILHRENDIYHQWLEGPEEKVSTIFARIRNDDRHKGVRVLSHGHVASRIFQSWPMVYAGASNNSLFDWAALKGIPLHPSHPADVLDFLRHCMRQRGSKD
ncbi:MAG: BLUF domain-containing protein [Paracoccus sp. (in: a-proteobacteria)]|nr:BLUF domain-containing protein [Pseudomonadota bacterium]